MKTSAGLIMAALALAAGCEAPVPAALPTASGPPSTVSAADVAAPTTLGAIALDNLDQQIRQQGEDPQAMALWLIRLQFLADDRMLDRLAVLADQEVRGAAPLLQRAQARLALHRFVEAERDLASAALQVTRGAGMDEVVVNLGRQRAALLVATGRAAEALPALMAEARRRPGFASYSALARAEAATGRLESADGHYRQALGALDTTSPFPAAAIAFARGLMWAEQGGDPVRGEAFYDEALRLLPDYVAAGIHRAELALARGDGAVARHQLLHVLATADEPEALALMGELRQQDAKGMQDGSGGGGTDGDAMIHRARQRYDDLLCRHPQAFADHAAEFYLGAGADPRRAWTWAQVNLRERSTRRAYQLAIRAAEAVGETAVARDLRARMAARHGPRSA